MGNETKTGVYVPNVKKPKELKLVREGDGFRVFIDDIEIPFECELQIMRNRPSQFQFGGDYYDEGSEITLTIRPETVVIERGK